MANGIEEIITTLYEMVQDAWSLPLGAEKCVVERDKVLDLLDEISNQLPGELKQAKTQAAAYDAAPSHSATNVRFFEGTETVGIYSEAGFSAMEGAKNTFCGDGGTEAHECFWNAVE